uniref:Uncharacterized protein n=1 Tax=Brassica campestris TaxID=3711 RepID=M4FF99_BRACM
MSSPQRLTREQKGKEVALARGSSEDPEDIHREAMMDTRNMDLAQHLLVSEAREQFRGDDDGQEAVDVSIVPISYYPGNIFTEESPLEAWRVRPSVVDGQDWPNVEKTKSTIESVEAILRDLTAHRVSFIIPKENQRPWSPPRGYQCVYESYFQNDTKLWFPIPRIVTAYAFRRGVALSQLMNGSLRLMVVLSVIAAEAGTSLSVRSFEELTSVSISDDGLVSTRMRPNYNVVTGYPTKTSDWQRSYFYVKSNRSAFEEPPRSSCRVLWNAEMVGHPNLATYPEDWRESARTVALQRQDHWENFTREKIHRSIDRIANQDWISDSLPHINQSTTKRLSLFTRAEQKEINRAKSMKQLPDLSLIMAGKIGAKRGASGSKVGPSGSEVADVVPVAAEQALTGGSSPRKNSKKKKKDAGARKESNEEEQTDAGGSSKKGGKKRKAGDLPAEDAPKKKKTKKKDSTLPRPSSVCEEELQALVPETVPESHGDWNVLVEKYDSALKRAREQVREGEEARKKTEEALRATVRDKADAITREKALRKAFDETRTADAAELQMCKESMKNLEFVLERLGKEKADLEKVRAAESLKHTEEMNRLRKSRRYEVTHERIRVMIAMIAKAEKCFHRISLREEQRDKYDEARCLQGQAFGTRRCLERIKDSGTEIPQEIIDTFAEQEEHYKWAATRLEVKEIPKGDLRLSPLVLESRFLIDEIWRQIDPFGSNVDLIDSEAAKALRTPRADRDPRSEDRMKEPAQTAGSSTQCANQEVDLAKQTSAGAVIPKDGAVPTIVLTDSPAKASKNLSSSTSSSEDLEKEDGVSAGRPEEVPADLPILTFGRVSGPREGDSAGSKDPPVVDG